MSGSHRAPHRGNGARHVHHHHADPHPRHFRRAGPHCRAAAGLEARPTFVRTAVALTALSFVPDLTFGFDAGSAATLITLHTVAAAIVVPTLAGRLARTR